MQGLFGVCYNRRYISNLGGMAANAQTGHYFHRYSQGEKVKSFAPVGEKPQNGRPTIERREQKAHLIVRDCNPVLIYCGTQSGWS